MESYSRYKALAWIIAVSTRIARSAAARLLGAALVTGLLLVIWAEFVVDAVSQLVALG